MKFPYDKSGMWLIQHHGDAILRLDQSLFKLLGGVQMMIESPRIAEVTAPRVHRVILAMLRERFGSVGEEIATALAGVIYDDQLEELGRHAARCPDLATFHQRLKELPPNEDVMMP